MSSNLLASKVVVVEEAPQVRGIPGVPTSVTAAIGTTEKGPFGKPVLCTSFEEYKATFGGFTADGHLALAAAGFFENGGNRLWVSRVASDTTAAASVELSKTVQVPDGPAVIIGTNHPPYAFEYASENLRFWVHHDDTDEFVGIYLGGSHGYVVCADEPYALADGQTLIVAVDHGSPQTLVFHTGQFANIAQAGSSELEHIFNTQLTGVRSVNGFPHLDIESLTFGTGSRIEIVGGTAAAALGLAGASGDGEGLVVNSASVSLAEILAGAETLGTIPVEFFDAGNVLGVRTIAVGSQVRIYEDGGGAEGPIGMDTSFHFGTDVPSIRSTLTIEAATMGSEGNLLTVQINAPTGGVDGEFDFLVLVDDVVTETFTDVSRDVLHARFIETVVNDLAAGSKLVRVTNQSGLPGEPPDVGTYPLVGGDDGAATLTDADYVGTAVAKTGLHAFDAVQDLSLILVPGRATAAIHSGMLAYCEEYRDGSVFAILDPPADANAEAIVTYVTTTASLESSSEFGAIYWPRVQVLNPDRTIFGDDMTITVPPSGIIAGVFSRTDSSSPGGVFKAPAGVEAGRLFGVLGFTPDDTLIEPKRDLVFPHRINPLTTNTSLPKYIDGSRTLKGSGNFPSIAARRGVIFIAQSLKRGLAFARHKDNTPELRAQVRRTVTAFLLTQMNNGAFRTREPSKAFYVDVSDTLNPPSVVASGKLVVEVGVAMTTPAEFIVIQISQDTRAIDEELAGGG